MMNTRAGQSNQGCCAAEMSPTSKPVSGVPVTVVATPVPAPVAGGPVAGVGFAAAAGGDVPVVVGQPVGAAAAGAGQAVMGRPVQGVSVGTAGAAAAWGAAAANDAFHGVPLLGAPQATTGSSPVGLRLILGRRGPCEGLATPEGVPMMLPSSMLAWLPMRPTKMGIPQKVQENATVLGPGCQLVSGAKAVSAGPKQAPKGWRGLVSGGLASTILLGDLGLVGAPLGYVVCKKLDRKQNTVGMYDPAGNVVSVKLWKAGKHAPLTEAGYWLVASDPRDTEMEIYILRLATSLGLELCETSGVEAHWCARALAALARRHSGKEGVSSLARLQTELRDGVVRGEFQFPFRQATPAAAN